MKSIREFFYGKEEEEVLPFQNMQPFSVEVRTKRPTDQEIDENFTRLMKELDFESAQRKKLETMTIDEKWNFIQDQQDHERRVPTPEWIISQLSENFDIHYITSIGLNLRTARLSWVERFCNNGGHILLVRELLRQKAYHQLFINNFAIPPEASNEILKALKAVVDTRYGSQSMLVFVKAIEVIICTIDIFDHKQFETILYILLPYVFMEEGPRLIINAFKVLARHNNHRLAFRVFADEVAAGGDSIFSTFITGLYRALADKYSQRLDLAIQYQKAGIPDVLRKAGRETDFVNALELDINEIALVFKGSTEAYLNCAGFGESMEGKVSAAILPSIYSLEKNSDHEIFVKVVEYVKAFLTRFRAAILKGVGPEEALQIAHEYAMSGAKPPQATGLENKYAQHLAKTFNFASDAELNEMSFPEIHGGLKAELEAAKAEIQELRALDAEGLQKDLEAEKAANERLKIENTRLSESPVLKENEQLRERIAQLEAEAQARARRTSEASSEEVERLRAENAQLLKENAGLQSQLSEAQELVKAIPQMPELSKSKLPAVIQSLKGIKADSPEAIAERIQKVIDDALACNDILNQERTMQANQHAQLKKVRDNMMEKLSESRSTYVRKLCITEESDSGNNRRFPWRILESADGVWDKVNSTNVDDFSEKLDESFQCVEVPEGKILSHSSMVAYAECLERSGLSPEELIKCIKLESFSVNTSALDALQRLPSSPIELKKIRELKDKSDLSNPERFAALLDEIPNWRESILNMLEYHHFDDDIAVFQSNVHKVEYAIKSVNKSEWFPKLLKVVEMAGNHLNGDDAKSFSIACLGNLKSFKTNSGMSLANIVADIIGDSDIEVEKLRIASSINIFTITAQLRAGQAALARRPVSMFTVSATRRLTNILKSCDLCCSNLLELSNQLGVEFGLPGQHSVLQIILNAVDDIKRAIKENKMVRAPVKKVDTSAPVKRETKVVVEDDRARGILTTMINALKVPEPISKEVAEEGPTDFQIAFSRVRKNISK